jgi:muconolactone delta-isomerase
MRVAVIYRPRNPPPPDAIPTLIAAMGRWVEKYRMRFSTLEFFVAGGGFGVIDVDDSEELQRITAENPFTPFSEVEIRPVVEPSASMAITSEAFAARAQAAG